jgi:hypothetical protein
VPGTARSFTMSRLVTGRTYTLSVQAVTGVGTGPAASGKVTIQAYPGVPTAFTAAQATTSTATMKWAPPASAGGHPITGYRVSRDGVDSTGHGPYSTVVAATSRSFTMSKLIKGHTYTLSVQAVTPVGTGAAASGKVTIK